MHLKGKETFESHENKILPLLVKASSRTDIIYQCMVEGNK